MSNQKTKQIMFYYFSRKNSLKYDLLRLFTLLTVGLLSSHLMGCGPKQSPEEKAKTEELIAEVTTEIELNEISKPYTPTSHPHLYKNWGNDWMEIINTMRPLAAERVQVQEECDQVSRIELSPDSQVEESPMLTVHCENNEYYLVSLGDVTKEKRLLPASKLFGKTPEDYIEKCLDKIRPELLHPDSIIYDDINTEFTNKANGILEVLIPFTIDTGFETRVDHALKCTANSELEVKIELLVN